MIEFIFSKEGYKFLNKYKEMFDCGFRIDEPDGTAVLVDIGDDTFEIPEEESIEDFKALINESISTGRNFLESKYSKVEYDNDMIY